MTGQETTGAKKNTKRILRHLLRKSWIVAIVAVALAALVLCGSIFLLTPRYTASVMMYVSNSSLSIGSGFSISNSDLTAAQSLVRTYLVVLNSNSTLETVIREAELSYTCDELRDMLSAGAVNGTEVFEISVTSEDPKEAQYIANAIAVVLPSQISSVVDGSAVRVVDYAELPNKPSFPNYILNTLVAFGVGNVAMILLIVIRDLTNNTVRSEEYLTQNYRDIPLLAVIPDAQDKSGGYYRGYYSSYHRYHKEERGREG